MLYLEIGYLWLLRIWTVRYDILTAMNIKARVRIAAADVGIQMLHNVWMGL
jgi:hypothetical protein